MIILELNVYLCIFSFFRFEIDIKSVKWETPSCTSLDCYLSSYINSLRTQTYFRLSLLSALFFDGEKRQPEIRLRSQAIRERFFLS